MPLVAIGGGVILRAAVINRGDNHVDEERVGEEREKMNMIEWIYTLILLNQ